MNNILTTKTVFNTNKLIEKQAIHIREYMKNDTNHLIRETDCLIMKSTSDYIRIVYIENGIIENKIIYVKDIENDNVEIDFLKE